jgi:hypothetical protein
MHNTLDKRVEVRAVPSRTAILRLYDYLATQIRLDFTTRAPHVFGCNGTLAHTFAWLATAEPMQQDEWQTWLSEMCIDCDCAMLLQLNTLSVENGALEGINMRRCSSCNALLALYQVGYVAAPDHTELIAWAAESKVPAYAITLSGEVAADRASVTKIYPAGATFTLSDRQFFGSVLRQLEMQHSCRQS